MKIAYVLNTTQQNNGATKMFKIMLCGLMPMGITPFVVVPDKGALYQELQSMEVFTHVLNYRPPLYPHHRTVKETILFVPRIIGRLIVNRITVRKLARFIKEHHIDIVHTNVGVIDIGFKAAQKAKTPHVYHIREYGSLIYSYFPCSATFIKQLIAPNSFNICITKGIQDYYGQSESITSRVVYDGVVEKKKEASTYQAGDFFLFVGRIEPVKGIDMLLHAYKTYTQKCSCPLKLLVAGTIPDTPYSRQQQAYVKEDSDLSCLIEFLGERDDVDTLMGKARAIIIPSTYEGFGLCMPEAMLQGCLVIGRNTSGTKEQLDNGLYYEGQEIGLRFETTEQLTTHLLNVFSPLFDYQPYVQRAFHAVSHLYSTEKYIQQIFQFYQCILGHQKAPA